MAQILTLPDGRKVDYLVSGSTSGFPLVYLHGTPGAYLPDQDLLALCNKKNLKLITLSRAGYGGSSRNKGRRVIDAVADIQAVLNHLDIKECVAAGMSGGGPHVLACAARLRGCLAAVSICGSGPYCVDDLDFFAGQGKDNVEEYTAALQGEESLQQLCKTIRPSMIAAELSDLVEGMSSLLPEADKKVIMENKSVGEGFVQTICEALRVGVDGWVDDDLAFISPWGFELSEIQIPVGVWQGGEDKMVPFAHGKWLAEHLPKDRVKAHFLPEEGHISIFYNYMVPIFEELLQTARQ